MRDDKRERILAAAAAVFAERDFHRVLVSEVAARAGVGKGTVYLYFPTKDHLRRVALEASVARLASEVVRAAGEVASLEEVLRGVVLVVLRFFWRRQHLLTLALRHEQMSPRRARERREQIIVAVERLLGRHRAGGSGPARRLSAAFLLGLARAAILEHPPGARPEATADRVVDLYLNGLGARSAAVGARRQRGAA